MQIKSTKEGGKTKVSLSGRFDFNSHREFRGAYEPALTDVLVREVEIDLGAVDYLDSSALGMLLLLREKATASQKSLSLTNCRGIVKQVLDVANFGKLFTIR
ncbi:MAG: STAS domain-containing protein [Sulfuricellaceae bacterium]|nr:STAS domain-containing protein [Sulfuricellaceae bacterium]